MKLNVQLFGPLADAAGRQVVQLEVPAGRGLDAGGVLRGLAEACPELRPMLGASRLAVNCAFAAPEDPVRESDELALIGMVSGG